MPVICRDTQAHVNGKHVNRIFTKHYRESTSNTTSVRGLIRRCTGVRLCDSARVGPPVQTSKVGKSDSVADVVGRERKISGKQTRVACPAVSRVCHNRGVPRRFAVFRCFGPCGARLALTHVDLHTGWRSVHRKKCTCDFSTRRGTSYSRVLAPEVILLSRGRGRLFRGPLC